MCVCVCVCVCARARARARNNCVYMNARVCVGAIEYVCLQACL